MSSAVVTFEPVAGFVTVPAWSRYAWLRAGFSTRHAGRSVVYGPGEQNLGWTKEDAPETVAANRAHFLSAVAGAKAMPLTTLHQIHGAVLRDLESEATPWRTPEGKAHMQGDGILTGTPGQFVGVITADCVPVLLADTRTHAVAALHAGWRGTLARIVEKGVAALTDRYGSRPEDVIAAIGPAIRACCFEVGDEVRQQFQGEFGYADSLFTRSTASFGEENGDVTERLRMDLQAANRQQLLAAGVAPEHISVLAECTACARLPDGRRRYFSHRSERGVTGRMLNVIGAIEA